MQKKDLQQKSVSKKKKSQDSEGAKMYMIVIMLIYAFLVLLVLISVVKPNKIGKDDTDREKAAYLIRNMQEHTVTQKILEQLKNKEYRKKFGIFIDQT